MSEYLPRYVWQKIEDADMSSQKLIRGQFNHSCLFNVNLSETELCRARFQHSYLRNVDFSKADLRLADFRHARIENCIFSKANIYGACFRNAYISKTELGDASKSEFSVATASHCPSDGSFIGWKKVLAHSPSGKAPFALLKLEIPENASRRSLNFDFDYMYFGDAADCWASYAYVIGAFDKRGNALDSGWTFSGDMNSMNFCLAVGSKYVNPDPFSDGKEVEFCLSRQVAWGREKVLEGDEDE